MNLFYNIFITSKSSSTHKEVENICHSYFGGSVDFFAKGNITNRIIYEKPQIHHTDLSFMEIGW